MVVRHSSRVGLGLVPLWGKCAWTEGRGRGLPGGAKGWVPSCGLLVASPSTPLQPSGGSLCVGEGRLCLAAKVVPTPSTGGTSVPRQGITGQGKGVKMPEIRSKAPTDARAGWVGEDTEEDSFIRTLN